MHPSRYLPVFIALVLGLILALLGAWAAANQIESRSERDVKRVLRLGGLGWAQVQADGLRVHLSGTAPDEATRFRALKITGTVIDATRIIDDMQVDDPDAIAPPDFSLEILRNDQGISLIGLAPDATDRDALAARIREISDGSPVTDLLDTASYPAPAGWQQALDFGLQALARLPRSKISIAPGRLSIEALSDSAAQKAALEQSLRKNAPEGLDLSLNITAPRPVISPYTLRFIIDEKGPRFDACTTETQDGRARILAAARKAGLSGDASCTIGLGMPSPRWDDAAVAGIGKLAELGGGSITFSDTDVTLVAPQGTDQARFDSIAGELDAALPDTFSLRAILPPPKGDPGAAPAPEFVATRSPEGDVRLRGRVPDARTREAILGLARARFGSDKVRDAMRLDDSLPHGWPTRILSAIEALSHLSSGVAEARPEVVVLRGKSHEKDARAQISRLLSEKLGKGENFRIEVAHVPLPKPKDAPLAPQECVDRINKVLKVQQITFAPNSAEIDDVAGSSLDHIAEILRQCQDVPMEVAGHTDSQGRESMNLALSQARAEAVIQALLARRVLTSNLVARGYGESQPIADNKTEEGRNANRRIEFRLIAPQSDSPADDGAPGADQGRPGSSESGAQAQGEAEQQAKASGAPGAAAGASEDQAQTQAQQPQQTGAPDEQN